MPDASGLTAALIALQAKLPRITKTTDAGADAETDEARDARAEQAFESRYGRHVDGFADND